MTWEDDFMFLTNSLFSEMRLLVEGAIRLFEDDASVLCRLARDAEKHEAMSALPFAELTITPERLVFRLLQGDAVLPYATKTWAEGVFPTTSSAASPPALGRRGAHPGGLRGEGRLHLQHGADRQHVRGLCRSLFERPSLGVDARLEWPGLGQLPR